MTCRGIPGITCYPCEGGTNVLSRELVKETLNQQTNHYEKLANISYDKSDGVFRCDNLVPDDAVDVRGCCRRAEELFELYQRCANRRQVETICANYLRSLESTKVSIAGHMYFVPRTHMEKVDIFEDFLALLSRLNRNGTPLTVNSLYVIDDAKQRDKMAQEFYIAVKKEILEYQDKCDYFIKSGSNSPAVMDRWVLKVQALEERKRHYEAVLRQELNGLDDEFSTLKFLAQELQLRANSLRAQKKTQKGKKDPMQQTIDSPHNGPGFVRGGQSPSPLFFVQQLLFEATERTYRHLRHITLIQEISCIFQFIVFDYGNDDLYNRQRFLSEFRNG